MNWEQEVCNSGKLNDDFIIKTIKLALKDYEDGAIIEAADALELVANAIRDFVFKNE